MRRPLQHIVTNTNIKVDSMEAQKQPAYLLDNTLSLERSIDSAWSLITPFWPLENLVAVNPLSGLESFPFEDALLKAKRYFQRRDIPKPMQKVNQESIKWLQSFFDSGQSIITMPLREKGLLKSVLELIQYEALDRSLKKNQIKDLIHQPLDDIIPVLLEKLNIPKEHIELFLSLMLTSLPGWAAHIQYREAWSGGENSALLKKNFLALRLALTYLHYPNAYELIDWHSSEATSIQNELNKIQHFEEKYQSSLLNQLQTFDNTGKKKPPSAQFVFCIDVRSEPFRRTIEKQGDFETFGYAGFFGVPLAIHDPQTDKTHSSCPVLLKPAHTIPSNAINESRIALFKRKLVTSIKCGYQALKYTFTAPFCLVEIAGPVTGLWMAIQSLLPKLSIRLRKKSSEFITCRHCSHTKIDHIPLAQQVNYAETMLQTIGLTDNFSKFIILCAHGSTSHNNAFASALDCGACGGRNGLPNAEVLAAILNSPSVRKQIKLSDLHIPEKVTFLAATHNTTTDEVKIKRYHQSIHTLSSLKNIESALTQARKENCHFRSQKLDASHTYEKAESHLETRAHDWAQTRPEWGLAKNAAFIIGPRDITHSVDLDGRAFLHSYHWRSDKSNNILSSILMAPMIVAQWINSQYLFSTLDNVAFGCGSKITKNVTSKIGVMQGNASDLMHGLPLQSVYSDSRTPYHQLIRLTVIIHSPQEAITNSIQKEKKLLDLSMNGWIHIYCLDPIEQCQFQLKRDLTWQKL